jgi:hypothetical protein
MDVWDSENLFELVMRFFMHFFVLVIVIRVLYYSSSKRKDYLFTYFLISSVIFLLSYMLENVKLQLGMALGLFAVFGIIRYRTSQIPIREMTYLFIVIGLAVINALANKKVSFAELAFTNAVVILITWGLEKLSSIKHVSRKVVQYDKIENIKPENYFKLKEDLEDRLGFDITKIEVGKVDFLRDTAKLVVYYNLSHLGSNLADDMDSDYSDSS